MPFLQMNYSFYVCMSIFIVLSLCSTDTTQSNEHNPVPFFSFNYKTFDEFTCNFEDNSLNPESSLISINAHNDLFEIFCIFFQISQLIKNEKFSEEFIKLLCYNLENDDHIQNYHEDEVDDMQESMDHDKSMASESNNNDYLTTADSLQQDLGQYGSHLIDKVLEKYSLNLRQLSFEKKDDLFFVTCKSPIVNPVDLKDVTNFNYEDIQNKNTKLGRLPINLGRKLSEKLLDSKDSLINFFIDELVDGTTKGFANVALKTTLKGALKTSKAKRYIWKYLRLANDLRKNLTNNPLECIDTIEEILRNALKDSSKIKFEKGNVSEKIIEDLVKKCIEMLK